MTRPLVMGVLNVTPDSFSDGGRWADRDAAVEHGRVLVEEGRITHPALDEQLRLHDRHARRIQRLDG